jgi:hypothetical protein
VLPNTLTLKLYVERRKSGIILKGIENISNKKVLADPLTKAFHPVCSENAQSTWVYGIAYDFRTIKGLKLKNLFQNRDAYYSC